MSPLRRGSRRRDRGAAIHLRLRCPRRRRALGVDLFIEDGAYTSTAAAVAIVAILALVFSAAIAVWDTSRAGDVQAAGDASALAGANVVSSYHTAATVVDACVLSMGLAGFAMTGVGLVGMLVPGVSGPAAETANAGIRMIKTRNEFAASASRGLKSVEASIPYLVVVNATRTCAAQAFTEGDEEQDFAGSAIAVPRGSASEFPALEGAGIPTDALEESSGKLKEAADLLARASEETEAEKREVWLADCGRDGMNMQERAASLSGLSAAENPDYKSSLTWKPEIGLARAQSYYRWRMENEKPASESLEERVNSAARLAFYRFACSEVERAEIVETDDGIESTVELLPRNTEEMRGTEVYTEAVWPTSIESGVTTLHALRDCDGAIGAPGPAASLKQLDDGSVAECPKCRFGIGDVGKVPAASTSIENGFEYHFRAYVQALDRYVAARNREIELEKRARGEATVAGESFEEAISALAGKRPRIAPPGRFGCVAFSVTEQGDAPQSLSTAFARGIGQARRRAAISAAVPAPVEATAEHNVLADFLSGIERLAGADAPIGLIDSVMDLWGSLLLSYGEVQEGLSEVADGLAGSLDSLGAGPIARWLGDRVGGTLRGFDLDAPDLRSRKPVLVDSARVLEKSDSVGFTEIQDALRTLSGIPDDPEAVLRSIGYEVGEHIQGAEFTIATIELPGGGSIPLTIRLRDLIPGGSR